MPAKKDDKLSPLAKKLEVTIRKVLDDIARDIDRKEAKYSLTDFMKVADRALKLEAIRNAVKSDDEGSFFTQPFDTQQGADDDAAADDDE